MKKLLLNYKQIKKFRVFLKFMKKKNKNLFLLLKNPCNLLVKQSSIDIFSLKKDLKSFFRI